MSKNLSKGRDNGHGVRKINDDGTRNQKWEDIHGNGTPPPKGAISCGSNIPSPDDLGIDDDDD